MKKLFSILVFLPLFLTAQEKESTIGWMFINENTIPLDKQSHFIFGGWGGVVGYSVAYGANGKKRGNAKLWGIVTATVLGTLKEVSDINTTGFDNADLAYTIAGGVFTTYTFDFLVGLNIKKQKKRQKAMAIADKFYD
jgi:hypothetical protein